MAFFENLGQKLSKGGQDAIQKTKDMAEIVQLNSEISEDRKKLDKIQREVGSLVMTENFHDLPVDSLRQSLRNDESINKALVVSDWKALYEKIIRYKEAEERIAGARQRIAYLKGEEYCPACGAQVAPNAAFCPNCGTKLVHIEPPAHNKSDEETADADAQGETTESAEEGVVEETTYTEVSEAEASAEETPEKDPSFKEVSELETDEQETVSDTTAAEADETVSEEPLQPDEVESGDVE